MKIHEAPEVYSKLVHESEDGTEQVRLTVNEFRGVDYLHLRKYYLDFEGDFRPSKDGVSMPLDFFNSNHYLKAWSKFYPLPKPNQFLKLTSKIF